MKKWKIRWEWTASCVIAALVLVPLVAILIDCEFGVGIVGVSMTEAAAKQAMTIVVDGYGEFGKHNRYLRIDSSNPAFDDLEMYLTGELASDLSYYMFKVVRDCSAPNLYPPKDVLYPWTHDWRKLCAVTPDSAWIPRIPGLT